MKNVFKYFVAAFSVVGLFACTELEQPSPDQGTIGSGEKVRLILNASKGETKSSPDTKVFVGQTSGGKVTYYWNENDKIGVIPLDVKDAKPNYVTTETQINPGNKNQAQFESYIKKEGYSEEAPDLLIYYPYNSSMLEGTTGETGEDYARNGLTFRLPQQQEQYGYSRTYVGEATSEVDEHPSVWAISNYGLAYDLATSTQSEEVEGDQTISNLKGEFQLDHVNTYFQFNVYGTNSGGANSKDYGNGDWKLASVVVEAGNCEMTTDNNGETTFRLKDQINLAGTYRFEYQYDEAHFSNVKGTNNNNNIKLNAVSKIQSVKVNMNNIEEAPALGGSASSSVPAFVVINGKEITANPYGNLNCLKVSVTCFKFDDDNNIVGSDTRVRYYNIGPSGDNNTGIVGTDISGNFYTINFEVCDPVESYTDLSVAGNANCYIINAPGNYSFSLDVAGNGKAPFGGFTGGISDPKNLIPETSMNDIKAKYGFDWLWASGLSFDRVKKQGVSGDVNIVKAIVNSVQITGETGEVSIGLNDMKENLSGNVVLALYEKNTDGSVKKIIWTWHLWLGNPQTQHYKFPATNYNWQFTNEDWYILDRNIGAERAEFTTPNDPDGARSNGLYYQRGRKEPIIGFNVAKGTSKWIDNQLPTYRNTETFGSLAVWKAGVAYNDLNTFTQPMSIIKDIPYTIDEVPNNPASDYTYAWNSSQTIANNENDVNNDTKSMFDPCPVGYRMPTTREWDNMKADKFRWTIGGQDFGVYGYCVWDGLAPKLSPTSTDERVQTYLQHYSTDKYTVNDQYERTYFINANSGTGSEVITYFPNTGTLNHDGEWGSTYQGSWTSTTPEVTIIHPAGPQLTAEVNSVDFVTPAGPSLTSSVNGSNLIVDFTDNSGTYYYATSSTGTKRSISDKGTISLSSLQYSNNSATLYFYSSQSDGTYSNATTVKITRSGNGNNRRYTPGTPSVAGETTRTTYTLNISFADKTLSYEYATSSTGTKSDISGSSYSVDCASLFSGYSNSVTIYFYYTDTNGVISAATTVTVNRSGSYSSYTYSVNGVKVGEPTEETIGGDTETYDEVANMLLWSSGRVEGEGEEFDNYWFGPASGTSDGWATPVNGDWGRKDDGGSNTTPFAESRETHLFGVYVFNLGTYEDAKNNTKGYAIPVRCIREYDNSSVVVVTE